MQVELELEGLSSLELVRLSNLFETLTECKRSKAFNRFLFWVARESEREIHGRRLKVPLRHAVSVDVTRMRPGELLFLQRQLQDWEAEFGKHAMGQLVELFWRASVGLRSSSLGGWPN